MNESKTLTKHISCEYKCKFGGRKSNSDQWWNNDKYQREYKIRHVYEKYYLWNSATHSCENGKYLASIMEDSAITSDEIQNTKNTKCKIQNCNFYILPEFLLVSIALLIAVSIYCHLIKY